MQPGTGASSIKEAEKAEKAEAKRVFAMKQEHWLKSIVEDESEYVGLLTWLREEGLERPDGFEERTERAEYLKTRCNHFFGEGDYRRALHFALGGVHYLDFTPQEQVDQSEEQRLLVARAMVAMLSNLALVFLKRGDVPNGERSASLGLRAADRLPRDESTAARAKLLYRRGLARGEPGDSRDLEKAHEDLLDAAKLLPADREIRRCLENCKKLYRRERRLARGEPVSDDEEPTDNAWADAAESEGLAASPWAICCRRRPTPKKCS